MKKKKTEGQKRFIILDGDKIEIVPTDLDGDGKVRGVERLGNTNSMIPVKETSEMGDALTEFNKDDVSMDRLSSIDFRTRINPFELPSMIALDSLIGMGVIPIRAGILNRVKMRKSVSLNGEGRKEFVNLVVGKQDKDMKIGGKQMAGNMMGYPQNNQQ